LSPPIVGKQNCGEVIKYIPRSRLSNAKFVASNSSCPSNALSTTRNNKADDLQGISAETEGEHSKQLVAVPDRNPRIPRAAQPEQTPETLAAALNHADKPVNSEHGLVSLARIPHAITNIFHENRNTEMLRLKLGTSLSWHSQQVSFCLKRGNFGIMSRRV